MKKKIIDLRGIKEKAELHELLKKKMRFPDYYGRNMDALYDLMTEPRFGAELTLLVDGSTDQKLFQLLLDTLKDAEENNPQLTVKVFREAKED
ncbi:MAG: barstar family protein [Lachnospiraceae bacterium]|nr:barstar family protein [Lachnospiraceae bacterium]